MPGELDGLSSASTRWETLSAIVDDALDLQAGERAVFLDVRCASNPSLRKEVEQFLAACDVVSRSPTFLRGRPHLFLNDLASDVDEREGVTRGAFQERVRASLADKYEVGDVLGSGGAAMVFRAQDRFTRGTVALKVLHPELSHGIGSDRFLREVRIVASLRHPNIIPLLSAGIADELPYYVMPCIDGQTLRARLQREPQLPMSLVLSVTNDVAAALDAAHAQGILHRDIKPQNILLDGDRALVADFGIARAIETAAGDVLTESGTVIGTPGYMSPEQVSGDAPMDVRSDVYSLACVVYEMLAGEAPFTGAQSRALLAKQLWAPVPDVRVLRSSLPAAVTGVLQRGLAKHAADRFENAGQFARALETAVASTTRAHLERTRPVVVLAVLSMVAFVVTGVVLERRREFDAALFAQADTTRLVAFPLEGTESSAAARDAVREAVSRWDNVSVVGGQALRVAVGGADLAPLSDRQTRDHVLSFRAARYIRTVLRREGGRLRVRGALFDIRRGAVPILEISELAPENSDSVALRIQQVADGLLLQTHDSVARAEGTTGTRSLIARQGFLRGAGAMREGRLASAESAYAESMRSDGSYARAALWLSLARIWAGKDSATWAYAAEAAGAGRGTLEATEKRMSDAVVALARGDRPEACRIWNAMADTRLYDFSAWYGAAQCMAADDIVLPDPRSTTGWRFRTGTHSALIRYRRAFALRPTVLGALRDDQFRRLRRLLWTSGLDVRTGKRIGERVSTFGAEPGWEHDSLAFRPLPLASLRSVSPSTLRLWPTTVSVAIRRQRLLFRDVARGWASANPESAVAREAVALALCLLGDPAAIDTLERARRLTRSHSDSVRLMSSGVWMRLQFALPSDSVALGIARRMADSALGLGRNRPIEPFSLASIAALTGRIGLADSLEAAGVATDANSDSRGLNRMERRLSLFAAAGGPLDSIRALEDRAYLAIRALPQAEQDQAAKRVFVRAATLAFPVLTMKAVETMPQDYYNLLTAVKASASGDGESVRRVLADVRAVRIALSLTEVTPDVLLVEASLLRRLGDVRGAAAWIAPGLASLRASPPVADAVRAAALIRAMILRADLAHELGDNATAASWGGAVAVLWGDADSFLQPAVSRMRGYHASRR